MEIYSIVLIILTLVILLSAFSDKIRIPYPILLVISGVVIGFMPKLPNVHLNPEVIFLIFLPPLLYDAAFNISLRQFKIHFHTIRTLAFPLVFFTATGIALFAHYFIPGMSWPLSFVLGAILSATDAVAAIGITKNLGLSPKAVTILEGESLINDASSLVAYKFALSSLAGASFIFWKAGIQFLILLGGGFLIGAVLSRLIPFLLARIKANHLVIICFILLSPFVTYLIAEELHVSGVIAVVTLGFGLSRYASWFFPDSLKKQTKSIWEIVIFLLNGLVFVLIGLQFPYVLKSIPRENILPYVFYSFMISVLVFILRWIWVFLHQKRLNEFFEKSRGRITKHALLDLETTFVVCWGGIRGIVPLAIALGLPVYLSDGSPFPLRGTVVFISVLVVIITIVGQGLMLPYIVKKLKIKEVKIKTVETTDFTK
ncbi:MAG TPA: Na+/H+ antiporter [Bacteroidales bacterium]|nr:Na+/H+ antiporter [Bacteroidales bacterium]